jgi:ABC-type glycerol-3-phosphate transport system substrate-binding protein
MRKTAIFISFILIFALILFSCGDNTETAPDNSGGSQNQAAAENQNGEQAAPESETAAPERLAPDLPAENFGGYTFNFLVHLYDGGDWVNETPLEILAEQEIGEPVNDAVYRRNMTITEKYNFEITMTPNSDVRAALSRAVRAGDNIYDATVMYGDHVQNIVTNDLLIDTSHLPYIDLDKPWWDPAIRSLSIINKNFLLAGDLLILDNEATNAILFNKKLMADLGLDLPYDTVREGKWTFDALHDIIRNGAAADLNGDGFMSAFEDRWGFCVFNDTIHALLVSGGGSLALKDENDIPYMSFTSPRNIAVLDKVFDMLFNPDYVLFARNIPPIGRQAATGLEVYKAGFEEDRILFLWARMRVVELFRGMESDFGIIPLPKFDEAQQNYYSIVNPFTTALLGVPKNAENLERVSIILEALAAESRYTLRPAYYDVVLQRKYTRDEESSEMLDIIFNSRVFDIGGVYSFGNVYRDFLDLGAPNYNTNVTSFYERRIGAMDAAIERVVEIFREME